MAFTEQPKELKEKQPKKIKSITYKSAYVVLEVKGGAGKGVIATQLVKSIKNKYPDKKIIVITGWDMIWINNPYVYKVFNYNQLSYFYDDFMKADTIIYKLEVYDTDDYVHGRKSLIEIWHEMYDLPFDKNDKPELFVTQLELNELNQKLKKQQPILLLHPFGSGQDEARYGWYRDLHPQIATDITKHYKQQGYRVIQPKMEHQLSIEGAEQFVTQNQRDLINLVLLSDKRILIDSAMQHIAAAANKESTVVFATDRQKTIFSHPIHDNIISGKITDNKASKFMVYEMFNFGGTPLEYPLAPDEMMYDTQELITSIDKQK